MAIAAQHAGLATGKAGLVICLLQVRDVSAYERAEAHRTWRAEACSGTVFNDGRCMTTEESE
ncbi:hypothetical protein BH24CHL2_BH24CHL2_3040 [soil metagenome]